MINSNTKYDRDNIEDLQNEYEMLSIRYVKQKALIQKLEEEIRIKEKKIEELFALLSAKEQVIISLRGTGES